MKGPFNVEDRIRVQLQIPSMRKFTGVKTPSFNWYDAKNGFWTGQNTFYEKSDSAKKEGPFISCQIFSAWISPYQKSLCTLCPDNR